jgi:hypothetical protein
MDKKKVVIIVIVVLLIIVIGVVAYTMSSSTPAPVAQKPAAASTAAAQLDPCAGTNDNSTNLSVECLRKIWRDSGCGNPTGIIADNYNGWWKQQTKKVVMDDMKAWATSTEVERRTACYGDDRTKWPATKRADFSIDPGYADTTSRPLKRGYYDIVGQGVANDYCRYTGDGENIKFRCNLSDGSNIFAETYKGKNVTDIVSGKLPDASATVESQGYKYVNGFNVPIRLNTAGNIECLSTPDGRNCMWKNNEAETRSLLASPMPANYSPLSCGEMHKNLYDYSGYDNPTHWCYKGMMTLNPNSDKIAFVQITRPSMNPGWYPYGASAKIVKSTIGVTNLESAISYARANGYSAFSFNENPTTSDANNSYILFFKEAEINTSTFFTSGGALPGFKVYATRDSKLKSSETFSFNLPQYLRHLQNKNYLL